MPSANRFKFSRSRITSVEKKEEGRLTAVCRLVDTLCDMKVAVVVNVPEMEIIQVQAAIERSPDPNERTALAELPKLAGIRIGPGMTKIFKGIVGPATADSQLLFMLEEACNGVILSLTREMALQVPEDQDLTADAYQTMVKANIRLYNRCAAFAPGSSLVAGITP
ncbi:MAG: hypothetical protein ACOZF0_10110 [Thermodesulfobacteriota bacterium]